MSNLNQLVAIYNSEGWKHFEKWIDEQIQNCILVIMDPQTPVEDVEQLRAQAYTYQSIKDKVNADQETLKQMESHKG